MQQHPSILQLTASGTPMAWLTYEEAAYYYAKDLVAWSLGEGYPIFGGINRATNQQSRMDLASIIAVKGVVNERHLHRPPTLTNRVLFRRDQHVCAYCGQEFAEEKLTRDHIMPSSRGGKDSWTNVVTACSSCNKRKDNFTLDEVDMELLYVPYVPSRHEYLILRNRSILADQMEFLKAGLSKDSRLLEDDFKQRIREQSKRNHF